MREYLFRGKRVDNGEWAFGYIDYNAYNNIAVIHSETSTERVNPETVGQYTGLQDKNRTKIFEGDVISAPHFGPLVIGYCIGKAALVGSKTNSFFIEEIYNFYDDIKMIEGWEVIGTIHDNPELLKH